MISSLAQRVEKDLCEWFSRSHRIIFNERDLQMQLAFMLRASGHYDDVELEYYVPQEVLGDYPWRNELRLDIVVEKDNEFLPIELKYKTKSVSMQIDRFGEQLHEKYKVIKTQGATDVGQYEFWKDVRRLELVRARFGNVVGGIAVFVTNELYYLTTPSEKSLNHNMSMAAGVTPRAKHWTRYTKTTDGLPDIDLEDDYTIQWRQTDIGGLDFRYTIVNI